MFLISTMGLRSVMLFHQRGELCLVSYSNCFCVDTKHGLKGKAFGTFLIVMRKERPWQYNCAILTIIFLLEVANSWGRATSPMGKV